MNDSFTMLAKVTCNIFPLVKLALGVTIIDYRVIHPSLQVACLPILLQRLLIKMKNYREINQN